MAQDWWSKEENVERYVQACFDYRTRVFVSQKKHSGGLSPRKLLSLAVFATANGLQFLVDSSTLMKGKSYAHSLALAVFALEEFGKAIYCYYAHKGWIRMEEFHKYMRRHKLKHEVLKSVDVLHLMEEQAKKLNERGKFPPIETIRKLPEVRSREGLWDGLSKLRSRALYVDYESPIAPLSIEKSTADSVLSFAGSWGNSVAELILESAHELFPDSRRSKFPQQVR